MTGEIKAFPTAASSDRIIGAQLDRQPPGGAVGKPGDICSFCLNPEADTWTIWPVASVDSRGRVLAVRSKAGETLSLWHTAKLDVWFVNDVGPFDPTKLKALLWRKFRGLADLRAAGREAQAARPAPSPKPMGGDA